MERITRFAQRNSACVLLVNIKWEKALLRTLKATPQEFQSCEMWSLVTVNDKPCTLSLIYIIFFGGLSLLLKEPRT